ncbi:MAG: tRNA 4-thiouridine(8) synthase ThiI [Candidatus Aegiribacteria sp.]|nr:tRNA 4-thiouridine(8) synthase ThiI [Candidatus Aegiribacteria sp.]
MGVRALGAFSGGLDSMLAALLLKFQGIEVELATFASPYFSSEKGYGGAKQLDLPWREIDFTSEIMALLKKPPSGFGKNLNPCIDCHASMFRILGEIAAAEGYDIIFSGEVAGQRPMSQNKNSLNRVARLSGYPELLLRPLSAKLLKITDPERKGLVDREKLLSLSGRSRKPQMKLAEEYGICYINPGGGCLLTDPNYCGRLSILMEIPGLFSAVNAGLVRYGRMFRLSEDTIGLVGRDEKDNAGLESLVKDEITFALEDRPGPTGVLIGDPEMLPELIVLVERYAGARSCI